MQIPAFLPFSRNEIQCQKDWLHPNICPLFYFFCPLFEQPDLVLNANQRSHQPETIFSVLEYIVGIFSKSASEVCYQKLFLELLEVHVQP